MIASPFSNALITMANKHNIPIMVDPKGIQINKYENATYITPNMNEFLDMTNVKDIENEAHIERLANKIRDEYKISVVILTRSEKGMSVISSSGKDDFPTKAKEVSDITGAGDTVVAAISFALATGHSIHDAVKFSNIAAGVVVSKLGTATASLEEIKHYG